MLSCLAVEALAIIALCTKSNGRYDIKAEKVKIVINQIFGHLQHSIHTYEERYFENIFFQTLEAIFPCKGVFFTKVVKVNIIAFIKTKIPSEMEVAPRYNCGNC